jgi:hypothetical protein
LRDAELSETRRGQCAEPAENETRRLEREGACS